MLDLIEIANSLPPARLNNMPVRSNVRIGYLIAIGLSHKAIALDAGITVKQLHYRMINDDGLNQYIEVLKEAFACKNEIDNGSKPSNHINPLEDIYKYINEHDYYPRVGVNKDLAPQTLY